LGGAVNVSWRDGRRLAQDLPGPGWGIYVHRACKQETSWIGRQTLEQGGEGGHVRFVLLWRAGCGGVFRNLSRQVEDVIHGGDPAGTPHLGGQLPAIADHRG